MISRKLLSATLGLALAVGTIAGASAATTGSIGTNASVAGKSADAKSTEAKPATVKPMAAKTVAHKTVAHRTVSSRPIVRKHIAVRTRTTKLAATHLRRASLKHHVVALRHGTMTKTASAKRIHVSRVGKHIAPKHA